MEFGRARAWAVIALLWVGLGTLNLLARPLMPIDETRYAAVAWEMWTGGDYLVPHLNGRAYPDKPPLLFWIVCAAWTIFGDQDWVLRLVGPALGLAASALTVRLARFFWPEDDRACMYSGLILPAFPAFALYGTALMFDILLTVCVLLAFCGVVQLSRQRLWRGLGLAALGTGLGILSKGPVAMVFILPVALAAPWWAPEMRACWRRYYSVLTLAVLMGCGIALGWAIPAARAGGAEYGSAILWDQTAERVAHSFAHEEPIWYYAAIIPVLFFPWIAWLPSWRGLKQLGLTDGGVRFAVVWCAGALVVLSLVSGKQAHYLLPVIPAAALAAARGNAVAQDYSRPRIIIAGAMGILVLTAGLVAASRLVETGVVRGASLPVWPPVVAGVVLLGAAAWWRRRRLEGALSLVTATVVLFAVVELEARPVFWRGYDTREIGQAIARVQASGAPLLHDGRYAGEFTFEGRLHDPLAVVRSEADLMAWCDAHPDGFVVRYWDGPAGRYADETEAESAYRLTLRVAVVHARAVHGT